MDEVHLCVLRALAVDETPAEREEHALDLALLDAMTWPCFAWEWLRLTGVLGWEGAFQEQPLSYTLNKAGQVHRGATTVCRLCLSNTSFHSPGSAGTKPFINLDWGHCVLCQIFGKEQV